MFKKKCFLKPLILFLLFLTSASSSPAQQNPSDIDAGNTPIVDSIDIEENLLDSNEAYKQKFDSLSKDGEWIKASKADFIKDLTEETGEDLGSYYPANSEVIYVWRPYCANFTWNPYYNGRWVFTSHGWIWMSDYSWGWGPYNYGRWHFSNYYGWVWLPGSVWACNWVTWRCNNNYVGWYPTCPRVYWRHHNNIFKNKKFASVPIHWIFLNKKDFTKKVDNNTIVKADKNAEILKNSVKVKSVLYDADPTVPKFKYTGPDVKDISKETGERIFPKYVDIADNQVRQNKDGTNVPILKDDGNKVVPTVSPSKIKGTKKEKTKSNDGWKIHEGTKESTPGKTNDGPKESTPGKNNEGTKGNTDDKNNDGNKGIFETDPKK